MKLEDLMALVRAGYTKDEISAMTAPAPAPEPALEPAPEPAPEPVADPAPQFSRTEALLREILGAVQMGNINKATIEPPVEKGADVVTARIINPNYGKEK